MTIDFSKYPHEKRFRHHTQSNIYFPLSMLKTLPNHYPPLIAKFIESEFFLNEKKPEVLDIGCGKGKFLLNYALENPDINVLGIEIRSYLVNWLKKIIKSEKIPNCSVVWYSVVNGLKFIAEGTIEKVFYLFPDPWPKKKHLKRRAFNMEFLDEVFRVLKPQGCLYLATDVKEVFDYQLELIKQFGKMDYNIPSENDWKIPITDKERFCLEKGIETYRLICTKRIT